jgi:hypothetical protein
MLKESGIGGETLFEAWVVSLMYGKALGCPYVIITRWQREEVAPSRLNNLSLFIVMMIPA